MHISRQIITLVLLSLLFLPACRAKQGGSIEGTIVPRGLSARITVMRDNKDILTVPAGVSDGKFKLALAAGVYAIKVTVPGSPYPLQLNDISVKSGESTVLPPIDLTPALGTGAPYPRKSYPRGPMSMLSSSLKAGNVRPCILIAREGMNSRKSLLDSTSCRHMLRDMPTIPSRS